MAAVTGTAAGDPTEPTAQTETTTAPTPETTTASAPTTEATPASFPAPETSAPTSTGTAAEPVSQAGFAVSAAFDQPTYNVGEDMTITLTITNTSSEHTAFYMDLVEEQDAIFVKALSSFQELQTVNLDGGASITNVLTGVALNMNADTGSLHVWLHDSAGNAQEFVFVVPVTRRFTTASGTVFQDKNRNGVFDSGEGVGNLGLTWTYKPNDRLLLGATTDSTGAFALELPPGNYYVRGEAPSMTVDFREVEVPESGVNDLLFKARLTLTALSADVRFTKDTYQPNEAPVVRVTLTNRGDSPLPDIVAICEKGENALTGESWGDLANAGVTVAPRTTEVFEFTEPMPARAREYGFVSVWCLFTFSYEGWEGPRAGDTAAVPGQLVTMSGDVRTGVEGADLSGFRIRLTSVEGCPIVAETVTGADGRFEFSRIQAGAYHIYAEAAPGWEIYWKPHYLNPWPPSVWPYAGGENFYSFFAYPSSTPSVLPQPICPSDGGGSTPTLPAGTAGPRGSSDVPGLAYTGVSLVAPGIAGLLALLVGTAAVVLTRRRAQTNKHDGNRRQPRCSTTM